MLCWRSLVLVINLPFTPGLNLAHLVPSAAALIIRDGLVLKGPGPEISVLQDNRLAWIPAEAFDYVATVETMDWHTFDASTWRSSRPCAPRSVLLNCGTARNLCSGKGHTRWIKIVPPQRARILWTELKSSNCAYLDALPMAAHPAGFRPPAAAVERWCGSMGMSVWVCGFVGGECVNGLLRFP